MGLVKGSREEAGLEENYSPTPPPSPVPSFALAPTISTLPDLPLS